MKLTLVSAEPATHEEVKEMVERTQEALGRQGESYSIGYIVVDYDRLPTPECSAAPWTNVRKHQQGKGPRGKWNKLC